MFFKSYNILMDNVAVKKYTLKRVETKVTYKVDYEKQHEGEDGTDYARQRIMEQYGLSEEEWEALYQKFVQEGYLDRAAQKLDLGINYLIKTDHQK